MAMNQDLINKIGTKLERIRDALSNECSSVREQLSNKLDNIDKFYHDQITAIEKMIRSDKSDVKGEINKTYETISLQINAQIETLKGNVTKVISEAQAHRETLQEKYNIKLTHIKDVCSQYFAKYQKHLLHNNEAIEDIGARQEVWIKRLIKPQELNEAKLFTLNTQLKENEMNRVKDFSTFREIFKKLIYAIEQ